LTCSSRNVFQNCLNFWDDIKKWCFYIHFNIFLSEVLWRRDSAVFPASNQFYCYYRSPEHGRSPAMPWSTVPSQHSFQFLVLGHVECWGRRVLSRSGLSLFLSVVMLLHRSRQIPKTAALCAKYWERWVYTSWMQGQNRMNPGSLWTSQTPIEIGLSLWLPKHWDVV
jgi:hypothetical protein